jgi:N-acetylneuraminate lyase
MKLKGLIAAVHTPMHDDFTVDYDRVPAQAEHLAKCGASGAFVTGTTGESHSLTTEERLRMFDAWGRAAHRNGLKYIAHVGHNNLPDAQALVRSARDSGADAISAMAPNFFKPADAQSLCDWFVQVTKPAPELPFYFYDIPSMTGVTVETDAFLDIAKERLPGFVGVKFTNQDYDLLQRCMANTSVKADMLFGTDERLIEGLGFGCFGAVGSTYNFASPLYLRIIDAFNRGDMESANEDQARSLQMIKRMYQSGFAAACKAAMGFDGVDCGPVRPPIKRISAENLVSLRKDLDAMGFFDWAIK